MPRPLIYVLAGVNGAGKSSLGGRALTQAGLDWFNPDAYAREWATLTGCALAEANGIAWCEGVRRLDDAAARGRDYAFETTLGGNSIAARLRAAVATHDIAMWFCGLDSPEHHIARVRLRVAGGGHDIPAAKIRERHVSSLANLIALLPHLSQLQVYDNGADAEPGAPVPNPRLLLQMEDRRLAWPTDAETLGRTPGWAKPVLEAALMLADPRA
ncbi:hypothetical protein [Luteimonas terricola]|uniref:UDP-N-acetylglucosamine kinase n=1 Tax=Luteimonas terricola TaxID=645597 RepID=A0ABQ2ELN1_9GAMM|nr:hypothetical protein [Luteimonas terricola]GGK15785.1 hypothetical protein GCM10011394_26180 [Luteimonas terricola]